MIKIIQKSFILLVVLCLMSCTSTYMQVIDISCDSLEVYENTLLYENEDLKVYYNFYISGAKLNIEIQNKNNKDIFFNKGLSCLVVNGKVVSDRLLSTSDTNMSVDMLGVVCIPAKSSSDFKSGKIFCSRIMTGDMDKDYPMKSYVVADYAKGHSPLFFAFHLIYGNSPNETTKNVNNEFWINRVTNYRIRKDKDSSSYHPVSPCSFHIPFGYKTSAKKGYGGY